MSRQDSQDQFNLQFRRKRRGAGQWRDEMLQVMDGGGNVTESFIDHCASKCKYGLGSCSAAMKGVWRIVLVWRYLIITPALGRHGYQRCWSITLR